MQATAILTPCIPFLHDPSPRLPSFAPTLDTIFPRRAGPCLLDIRISGALGLRLAWRYAAQCRGNTFTSALSLVTHAPVGLRRHIRSGIDAAAST